MTSVQGRFQVNSDSSRDLYQRLLDNLGLVYTDWIQPFEVRVTSISICSHSGWHYRCSLL